MNNMNKQSISLVVPMFNESAVINKFFEAVIPILERVTTDYEIVCINDGSVDETWSLILEKATKDSSIKGICLSRNFGKEIALTAGLDHATGDGVIPIDCDLQDPPELIIDLVSKWREGFDIVLAKRVNREKDTALKRASSSAFYFLLDRLSETPIPKNVGDFRLIDRRAVEYLKSYPERTRFMKGIFASLGFRETTVEYSRPERAAGNTKWSYLKLYHLAVEGITSFTSFPLKIWSYLGGFISLFAFVYGIFLIIRTLIYGISTPGYASLMVVMLFMSGLILLSLGVIGEYLSRIFVEVKNRPLYMIMDEIGINGSKNGNH